MGSYQRKDAYGQCECLFTWSQTLRDTQCQMPPGSKDFPECHHLLPTMTKPGSAGGPSHHFFKPLPHALPETWCLTRTRVPASSCSKDRPCAGDNHGPLILVQAQRAMFLCYCVWEKATSYDPKRTSLPLQGALWRLEPWHVQGRQSTVEVRGTPILCYYLGQYPWRLLLN